MAIGRSESGTKTVLAVGEAKCTASKRTLAHLTRLEHVRALMTRKHPSAASARLLLFSGNGFARLLLAGAVRRVDVELVDLDRPYTAGG